MHTLRHVIQRREFAAAPPTATVMEAARIMTERRVGALCILDHGRLVGIFSERDLMVRVLVAAREPEGTLVGEVMTKDVLTASLEESRSQCLERMRKALCRHLPVLERGNVIAMLSMRDLLKDEIEEQREQISGLHAYLHSTPL